MIPLRDGGRYKYNIRFFIVLRVGTHRRKTEAY
jgi:hypothetical protein